MVKKCYVIFIHLFDSGILLIIDLNKNKKGGLNLISEFYSYFFIKKKKKKKNIYMSFHYMSLVDMSLRSDAVS